MSKVIIKDNRGQWAHPGKNTRISSENITMKGVNYPVVAKTNDGRKKLMMPGKDYQFPGARYVDEFPVLGMGGATLTTRFSSNAPPSFSVTNRTSFGGGRFPFVGTKRVGRGSDLDNQNTRMLIKRLSKFGYGQGYIPAYQQGGKTKSKTENSMKKFQKGGQMNSLEAERLRIANKIAEIKSDNTRTATSKGKRSDPIYDEFKNGKKPGLFANLKNQLEYLDVVDNIKNNYKNAQKEGIRPIIKPYTEEQRMSRGYDPLDRSVDKNGTSPVLRTQFGGYFWNPNAPRVLSNDQGDYLTPEQREELRNHFKFQKGGQIDSSKIDLTKKQAFIEAVERYRLAGQRNANYNDAAKSAYKNEIGNFAKNPQYDIRHKVDSLNSVYPTVYKNFDEKVNYTPVHSNQEALDLFGGDRDRLVNTMFDSNFKSVQDTTSRGKFKKKLGGSIQSKTETKETMKSKNRDLLKKGIDATLYPLPFQKGGKMKPVDNTSAKAKNTRPRFDYEKVHPEMKTLDIKTDSIKMDSIAEMRKKFGVPKKKQGGKIEIKEENKGKFTKYAKSKGMSVQEAAKAALANRKASASLKKQANFAKNAAGWKKQDGGKVTSLADREKFHAILPVRVKAPDREPTSTSGPTIKSATIVPKKDIAPTFARGVRKPQGYDYKRGLPAKGSLNRR